MILSDNYFFGFQTMYLGNTSMCGYPKINKLSITRQGFDSKIEQETDKVKAYVHLHLHFFSPQYLLTHNIVSYSVLNRLNNK